jgi:hypothetical protein
MTSKGYSYMQRQPELSQRLGSWRTKALALGFFALCSVGLTYPLVLNLRSAVPGAPWDNLQWLYDLWWLRHSIIDLHQWPTISPDIFYPTGYDLKLSELMLANKLLIAPFLLLGDEVLAYNMLLLLSFALTGYATFLWVSYLTDNRAAGLVGGTAFAFGAYRMYVMSAGWLPLIATQWIPLIWLYLERTIRERRLRFGLAAGLFMALSILSSWYYLYIVGVGLFIYLAIRLWPWSASLRQWHVTRGLVAAGIVTVLLVLPVALPVLSQRSSQMGWSLTETEKWAASIDDFLLPNIYHPIWGDALLKLRPFTQRYPWYAPGCVSLGVTGLLLAWRALAAGHGNTRVGRALVWCGAITLVLALGAVLHFRNEVVGIAVPDGVRSLFERGMSTLMSKWALHRASYYEIAVPEGRIPIPLPGLLLYLFVPLGNALRTMYRFGMITGFVVSTLAGVGAAAVLGGARFPEEAEPSAHDIQIISTDRGSRIKSGILGALLVSVIIIDLISVPLPFGMSRLAPQPLDLWLAAQPDNTVVMQFPLIRAFSGDSLYRVKYHGKRIAYGHGTFYPSSHMNAMPILSSFPSAQCMALLKSWGVTHIVVGSKAYDAGWGDLRGQTWDTLRKQIESSPDLSLLGVMQDQPIWENERISHIIQGSPPVVPILVDRVYVYEVR